MNRAESLVDALRFLSDHADADDAAAVELAAKTARIAAFLAAEGVADVLAAIRDGADVAADCIEGEDGSKARVDAFRAISRETSRALGRLA